MKKLFLYAVLWHKTINKGQDNETQETKLIVEPKHILASGEKTAATLIARSLPEECLEDLDSVEIIVRPF